MAWNEANICESLFIITRDFRDGHSYQMQLTDQQCLERDHVPDTILSYNDRWKDWRDAQILLYNPLMNILSREFLQLSLINHIDMVPKSIVLD